ncbi:MAG TPA: UTP--glucose-1-phosphate uridylyltransferase [Verrucomicrobiales bacterium]|nr:UTP--glucose-1-phosphate uridylyltransferase [Verrucomicrobiales bacterium]
MHEATLKEIEDKMLAGGVARPAINAFLNSVRQVTQGASGLIPETDIDPVAELPALDTLPAASHNAASRLNQLAVIKLNGGLGTGMGLDRAKSLIRVKGDDTFLDFIARQIFHLRKTANAPGLSFYLMNSFSTQEDSLAYLRKYPELGIAGELDFLQSKAPKLDAETLRPVSWPAQPDLEWCPPGHGDIYPSLLGSGLLDRLLERGVKFLFVSNSDNLGATVDLRLLEHFANADLSFMMEVCERTAADKKGGHLARGRASGRLLLRESAQCPDADKDQFQDITRHRFFNTNNLWIRLDRLKEELDQHGGSLPLALITNRKTVDPRDPASTKVLQLECAMGAAIENFAQSGAVVVPRDRFAPVKTTADLLALRSDAYVITDDARLVLAESRRGQPPVIDLDSSRYKLVDGLEDLIAAGTPSLIECESLKITGPFRFEPGVVLAGNVAWVNDQESTRSIPPGRYQDTVEKV